MKTSAREYQAIIAYVVYSQVLKGAQFMNIAAELEVHAGEELQHAITVAKQIDYLGAMPKVTPKPVKTSDKAEDMLRFDLENENETIRNYRQRVAQCEAWANMPSPSKFAISWSRNRIIKLPWRPRLGWTFPTSPNLTREARHAPP